MYLLKSGRGAKVKLRSGLGEAGKSFFRVEAGRGEKERFSSERVGAVRNFFCSG